MNYTLVDRREAPVRRRRQTESRVRELEELVGSLVPGMVACIEVGPGEELPPVMEQLVATATRRGTMLDLWEVGGVLYAELDEQSNTQGEPLGGGRPDRGIAVADVDDLVGKARRIFGDRLTRVVATGLGPEGPSRSHRWRGLLDDAQSVDRLHDAVGIAQFLLETEDNLTVQAWFVGKNPLLGDRAPALVIGEDPEAVRRAARHFLAYG